MVIQITHRHPYLLCGNNYLIFEEGEPPFFLEDEVEMIRKGKALDFTKN
jgi:hypothetical protein